MTGGSLILPDSNIYIGALRAGTDPFLSFARGIAEHDWEFATCGMIALEVCRGLRDPNTLKRFRERFGVMIFLPTTNQIWERATNSPGPSTARAASSPPRIF